MSGLKFHEVTNIPAIKRGYLFNMQEFQQLKKGRKRSYILVDTKLTYARCTFNLENSLAISGFKAPFGSIDTDENLSLKELTIFIESVITKLKSEGCHKIIIHQPPASYSGVQRTAKVLLQLGFICSRNEVNQHLNVDLAYPKKIRQKERNKLNKSLALGYSYQRLDEDDLERVFKLIKETHGRKDYPVTMGIDELRKAIEILPDNYLLFGLFDRELLIAAVISVQVSETILYNFYHADHADYRSRSPLVKLIGHVYEHCSNSGITMLDLGISSVNGQVNQGLFRFKENLGCIVSNKQTFTLEL